MSELAAGRHYSDSQLVEIREVISGLPSLDSGEIGQRDAAVADGNCPQRLWPLWPLARADSELWSRLLADERIERFSVYGLFPAAYPLVYGPDPLRSDIRFDGRTRGRVAIITNDTTGVVIKPCQSGREGEIAAIAGRLGVGPTQLPTVEGFISEEFVDGRFLTNLAPEEATGDLMWSVGSQLGQALSRLHAAGVCYNDATISDPDGRSHIMAQPEGGIRLIDFGVAILLDRHPDGLTFEDAWNAARVDPMFRLFRQMTGGGDDAALGRFVADYGRRLATQSVEQIVMRDWRIAEEGASTMAARFGSEAAQALRVGMADWMPA